MSSWLSAHHSYYSIDNRAAGGDLWEADTFTCNHCQAQVIREVGIERPREVCLSCMRVICLRCKRLAETFGCQPFMRIADDLADGKLEPNKYGLLLPQAR